MLIVNLKWFLENLRPLGTSFSIHQSSNQTTHHLPRTYVVPETPPPSTGMLVVPKTPLASVGMSNSKRVALIKKGRSNHRLFPIEIDKQTRENFFLYVW